MQFDSILPKLKQERDGASGVLILIGVFILGMVFGNILAAILMVVIGGLGIEDLNDINNALIVSPSGWWALILGQGAASLVTFLGAAWLYWKVIESKKWKELQFNNSTTYSVIGIAILLQLAFLPFNTWIQEVNQQMVLPEGLKSIEEFMRNMEDSLKETTEFMTTFSSPLQLLVGFLVIAVIAGVGEELIFRGLMQRKFYLLFKNPHLAIWASAIIFSAIHFQFYGFLPRLFLGALFGYFYYWTGNLWVSIIGHIFNNGFAVLAIYFTNQGLVGKDMEDLEHFPMPAVVGSVILSVALLWFFKRTIDSEQKLS